MEPESDRMPRKSFLKRIRRWLKPSDAWLYSRKTLDWLSEPATVQQFPQPFRYLFYFYRLQHRMGIGVPLFANSAFRTASRLYRSRNGARPIKLRIHCTYICLHPIDPRMLAVPGELRSMLKPNTLLRDCLRPGDTFVDVGANHGAFAIAAATIVGTAGMVIAIEPQSTHADLAKQGLAANNFAPYKVLNLLCSDRKGTATFYLSSGSSGRSSTFATAAGQQARGAHEIRATTLDTVLLQETIPGHAVIKLDVEGGEVQAIRGAREFIRQRCPTLILEVNEAALGHAGNTVADIADELQFLGYRHFRWCDDPAVLCDLRQLYARGKADIVVSPEQGHTDNNCHAATTSAEAPGAA